jgi:hypothetical protein
MKKWRRCHDTSPHQGRDNSLTISRGCLFHCITVMCFALLFLISDHATRPGMERFHTCLDFVIRLDYATILHSTTANITGSPISSTRNMPSSSESIFHCRFLSSSLPPRSSSFRPYYHRERKNHNLLSGPYTSDLTLKPAYCALYRPCIPGSLVCIENARDYLVGSPRSRHQMETKGGGQIRHSQKSQPIGPPLQ